MTEERLQEIRQKLSGGPAAFEAFDANDADVLYEALEEARRVACALLEDASFGGPQATKYLMEQYDWLRDEDLE